MVTTQGEMEVPMFFAPKGPRGTYSHFWMSLEQDRSSNPNPEPHLADQSFMTTTPKMCSPASSAVMTSPMAGH